MIAIFLPASGLYTGESFCLVPMLRYVTCAVFFYFAGTRVRSTIFIFFSLQWKIPRHADWMTNLMNNNIRVCSCNPAGTFC